MVDIRVSRDLGVGQYERTSVFIEGANFHIECRKLGFSPSYVALRTLFEKSCSLIHLGLFRAIVGESEGSPSPIFAGYTLYDRPGQIVTDAIGRKRDLGASEVKFDLFGRMVEHSVLNQPDRVVLMSSSAELSTPMALLRARNIKTTLVANLNSLGRDNALYGSTDEIVSLEAIKSQVEHRPPQVKEHAFRTQPA